MTDDNYEFCGIGDLPLDSDITLDEIGERLQTLYDFILENNLPVELPDPNEMKYFNGDKTRSLNVGFLNLMDVLFDFEKSYIISQLTSNNSKISDCKHLYNIIKENNQLKKKSKLNKYDRIIQLLCAIIPALVTLYTANYSRDDESIFVHGDVNVYVQSSDTQSINIEQLTEQLKELNAIVLDDTVKAIPTTDYTNQFEEAENTSENVAAYSQSKFKIDTEEDISN